MIARLLELTLGLLALLIGPSSLATAEEPPAEIRPISPSILQARLQRIANDQRVPNNEAERVAIQAEVTANLRAALDNIRVRYSARVSQVTWKSNVATLYVRGFAHQSLRDEPKRPRVSLGCNGSFAVVMTESAAHAIKPGAKLQIEAAHTSIANGLLIHSDEKHGQLLYAVRYSKYPFHQTWHCSSSHYTLKLNGESMVARWALENASLPE